MRGVNSAKGPDSSIGGVPEGICLDVDHMEEEIQVRVQVEVEREEQGIGETRKGTRRGTERTNQMHDMDDYGDDMTRSCRHLSQSGVSHIMKHVRCAREKVTCEVYLSTPRRLQ